MTSTEAVATPSADREPLTERILDWIGEPRWVWVLAWAGVAVVRPVILLMSLNVARGGLSTSEWITLLLTQVTLAYVALVGLVAVRRLSRGARSLAPDLASLAREQKSRDVFPGMSSTFGPLALLAIVAVPSSVSEWVHWGGLSALAELPLMLVTTLPIMVFVWTYLVVLAGLYRLGRVPLSLGPFPEDRALGLGPAGSLALTGFWLILAAAIPLILVSLGNVPTVALSLAAVIASVVLFFLSMFRIHRQMVESKRQYVSLARTLYAEAYEPIRAKPSLKTLEAQSSALGVSQALVDRAERILEWPIDERATAWVVVVITGVVTSLLVRLILALAGA